MLTREEQTQLLALGTYICWYFDGSLPREDALFLDARNAPGKRTTTKKKRKNGSILCLKGILSLSRKTNRRDLHPPCRAPSPHRAFLRATGVLQFYTLLFFCLFLLLRVFAPERVLFAVDDSTHQCTNSFGVQHGQKSKCQFVRLRWDQVV